MSRFVWINGRIVPKSKARISVFDSSYLYGEGIYETMRAKRGEILFFRAHMGRLQHNARLIGIPIPLSAHEIQRAVGRLLRKNRLQEAAVRLTLSHLPTGKPQLAISTRRCPVYPPAGRLIFIHSVTGGGGAMPTVKTMNRLANVLAEREIKKRKATEGVFLNREGHVTEGSTSNLFLVKGTKLLTPPLSDGLLPGTRRGVVIKLARKCGIVVAERSLRLRDLRAADEIFVTSTLKDILPIAIFEGKKVRQSPGSVTSRLIAAYNQLQSFLPSSRSFEG